MAKNTSATSKTTGSLALRGKVGRIGLVLATKTVSLVALLALYYVLVFFAAIRVVPLVMGFVKSGSGIDMSMPVDTVVAVWVAPSLFLIALVFALLLLTIRVLWRLRRRLVEAVAGWAYGRDAAQSAPDISPATAKSTRNRNRSRASKTA